jgi:hypothetical protein
MKIKTLHLLFWLFLFLPALVWGQKKKHIKLGDRFYRFKDYYSAVASYERAAKLMAKSPIKNSRKKAIFYYRYGECQRMTYNFTKAEIGYREVVQSKERERFPTAHFYYSYVLKHNGKYDEAAKEFEAVLQNEELKPELRSKAEQELRSCAVAKELVKKANMNTKIERLGDHINTKYSDFGPCEVGDLLYYSSLRFERRPTKNRRIYYAKDVTKHLVGKVMYSSGKGRGRGNLITELNPKYQSAGNVCASPDGQYLFFTICQQDHPDKDVVCAIHYTKQTGNAVKMWSDPVRLPEPINLKDYTSTHPNIGYDSLRGRQVLFFVSNRPGGVGSMDLWMAAFVNDTTLEAPVLVPGSLNSKEEEATPFFHTPSQTLYFSSKWHEGLGGYDVFKSRRSSSDPNSWIAPINVGVPLNSAANDLYFVINKDDSTGYFASNRPGSKVLTGESCCNDIYRLYLNDFFNPQYEVIIPRDSPKVEPPVVAVIDTPKVEPPVVVVDTPKVEPPVVVVDTPKVEPPVVINQPKEEVIVPQEKIVELNKLLPLALYFHDDEPDPNSLGKVASVAYGATHQNYLDMKGEYLKQYGKPQDSSMNKRLDAFFEEDVYGQFAKTNYVLDELVKVLDKGVKVELSLRGFTSARGAVRYNANLAKRRIDCVKKEILEHDNGRLNAYVKSGQLVLRELPFGETLAKKTDGDPRSAIYSVDAAKDRKVEIVALEIK